MTATSVYPNAPDLTADDYIVVGLATCFLKEEGELHEVKIAEPIPSAALEAIVKGIPTSYQFACAATIGDLLQGDSPKMLSEFPADAQFCDEFVERLFAATRTYKRRPEATEIISVGSTYRELNYSTERKRVLNSENIVKTEDNVKQHSYTHQVL